MWQTGSHDRNGFTLVELLVVITIFAVASVIAIPAIKSSLPGVQVRKAAREAVSVMREARGAAILLNTEIRFVLSTENNKYEVEGTPTRGNWDARLQIRLITADIERIDEQTAAIRFFPDGTSTGGKILIANGSIRSTVEVDWLTGRVFVARNSDD